MRKRNKIVTTALFIAFCSYSIAQSKAEEQLRKERSNLTRTTDPVSRTKIEIRISDLLITLMTEAARAGEDKRGFKDLEISLRKQQSRLSDAGKLMDIDSREAVDRVRKQASNISDQLVKTMLLKDPNAAK